MLSSKRATLHAALMWAMGLVLAAYAAGLALHGLALGPGWKGWFSTLVVVWLALLAASRL